MRFGIEKNRANTLGPEEELLQRIMAYDRVKEAVDPIGLFLKN